MKVTNFGPGGLPITLAGWSTGIVSLNSNVDIIGGGPAALNFVQRITSNTSNTLLNPIVNFASGSNIAFAVQSNTLTITGTAAGGGAAPTISAGSNSTRVSEDSSAGASTTLWSPFDHRHDGIGTITSSSSNTMQRGTWNVRPGVGIALSLTDADGDGEFDTTVISNTGGSTGGGGAVADSITGQIGSGGAIIPGLQSSIDIRVAGTNDDEFDTTDTTDPMTGWTTIQTPTAHNINSTKKSNYYLKLNGAAGIYVAGIYKASPSLPFTVTAQVTAVVQDGNSRAGLMIGEATPGKMFSLTWDGVQPHDRTFHTDLWTSPTVYGSSLDSVDRGNWPYLRIVCTSSTAVQAQCSRDGYIWFDMGTSKNPGFTIGSAGLIANRGTVPTVYLTSDWIRFT